MLTRSRNNHMFGTVVQWLFDTLAGYKPLKPGYEEIEYRPMVPANGLDWVRASTDTVRGRVATEWRKVRRGFNLDLEVPANATGVELVGREGDRVVYRVGSGNYKFRVRRSGD